jgi:hypothetical protein
VLVGVGRGSAPGCPAVAGGCDGVAGVAPADGGADVVPDVAVGVVGSVVGAGPVALSAPPEHPASTANATPSTPVSRADADGRVLRVATPRAAQTLVTLEG